jgi:predicted peroxiredoxin
LISISLFRRKSASKLEFSYLRFYVTISSYTNISGVVMKKLVSLFVFPLLMIVSLNVVAAESGKKVAVMLTSSDAQKTGMALHMAWGMQQVAGAEVTVIFGADSLKLALKAGDSPIFPPKNRSIRQMIAELQGMSMPLYICGMCANAQNMKQADFVEGVKVESGMMIMPIMADPAIKTLIF